MDVTHKNDIQIIREVADRIESGRLNILDAPTPLRLIADRIERREANRKKFVEYFAREPKRSLRFKDVLLKMKRLLGLDSPRP